MSDYCVKKLLIIPEGIVFAYSYLIQYILLTAWVSLGIGFEIFGYP